VWARASNERYTKFKEIIGRGVTLDNDTRWNSWLEEAEAISQSVERIYNIHIDIKIKDVSWQEKHSEGPDDDILAREHWQELQDTVEIICHGSRSAGGP
jgi:hypothetical protein